MKIAKIVNSEKFRNTLMGLGSNKEISETLNENSSNVSNWISGKRKPTSSNIFKILDAYKEKITPEQLGVKIYYTEINESFSTRLKELLNEYDLNNGDFAKGVGYSEGSVSKWTTGNVIPSLKALKDIADYFDVSVLYILGQTNIRNADNEDISQILQCSEYLLDLIKNDNPNSLRTFMGMIVDEEVYEEKYFDLKDVIFGNPSLLSALKFECDRVISYYSGRYYYNEFECTINQTEIMCQSTEAPIRFEIEEVSHNNIGKAISVLFDKYINMKLTEIYKKDERFKKMYSDTKCDEEITNKIKKDIGIFDMKKYS